MEAGEQYCPASCAGLRPTTVRSGEFMTWIGTVLSRVLVAAVLTGSLAGVACAAPQVDLRQVVTRLGQLNGIALACKQDVLAIRLREIMIGTAPKQREIGEAFEIATNEAFLAFGRAGQECPDGRALAEQIDVAHRDLRLAIGAQP